jgi:hypothetical protein
MNIRKMVGGSRRTIEITDTASSLAAGRNTINIGNVVRNLRVRPFHYYQCAYVPCRENGRDRTHGGDALFAVPSYEFGRLARSESEKKGR